MVLNADKCYYMCFGKDTENAKFYFDRKNYVNCKAEKYYADYCHRRRSFI